MFPLKHECTFYERVIALMEYKEIANPTELARQIFFKLDKHIKVDENTDHLTKESIRKRLTPKKNNPTLEIIKEYCDFFQCDADYLLGNIDSPNNDIANLSQKTGLSYKTIDCLCSYSDEIKELINRIVENDCDLLKFFFISLRLYVASPYPRITIEELTTDSKRIADNEEAKNMIKFNLQENINLFIDMVYNIYSDDRNKAIENSTKLLKLENEVKQKQIERMLGKRKGSD